MNNRVTKAAPTAEQQSSASINKLIGQIRKNAGAINVLIQTAALAVLAHTNDYQDCTGAARLVDALPKSFRRGLLAQWFLKYSPIIVEPKNGAMHAHLAKTGSKHDKRFDIDGATANPWFDMAKNEAEPDFFTVEDVQTGLQRLVARIQKKIDDGECDTAQVVQLRAYMSAIKVLAKAAPAVANDTNEATPVADAGEPLSRVA